MSDDNRNAADRVRHILQAMERSIVTARKRRLNEDQETQGTPGERSETPKPPLQDGEERPVTRLRARPKRPSTFTPDRDDRPPYQSQAS